MDSNDEQIKNIIKKFVDEIISIKILTSICTDVVKKSPKNDDGIAPMLFMWI